MSENIITSDKEGLDALFVISEATFNFGNRWSIRRVALEECKVTRIYHFNVPSIPNKITILEIVSESGIKGNYLPHISVMKDRYEIGDSLGKLSILKSSKVDTYLFTSELDEGKAKSKIIETRKKKSDLNLDRNQNITIMVLLLILLIFQLI